MTPSSCLPSARNTSSPQAFLLRNPHLHVPKHQYHETKLPKKENLVFRPLQVPLGPCLPFLSFRNSRLTHPFANLSFFVNAEGKKEQEDEAKASEDDLPGMAQAFNISSRTAFAIVVFIAFAALSLPFFMKSLGHGVGLKTKFLSYVTLLFGFDMAWNIGANDVANAMGTSVTSYYGWPVSTTHCIVGSMVEFGLVYEGPRAVFWMSLARVISSWVISPVMGALVSFLVYKCIRRFVYSAPNPGQATAAAAPITVFLGVTGISFAAFPLSKSFPIALGQALGYGAVRAFVVYNIVRKQLGHLLTKATSSSRSEPKESTTQTKNLSLLSDVAGPKGTQLEIVYGVFGYMQVLSACFMSFAHRGNDVSNTIGPLAAALSILQGGASSIEIIIPNNVLAWGGFGIVTGLTMWGYRVIAIIEKKITELTPTRGFTVEFADASVVIFASKLALPISASHTLVGAVMGVGFARGLNNVRAETVREIVTSWAMTIPVGASLAVVYTLILTKLLSFIQ